MTASDRLRHLATVLEQIELEDGLTSVSIGYRQHSDCLAIQLEPGPFADLFPDRPVYQRGNETTYPYGAEIYLSEIRFFTVFSPNEAMCYEHQCE